MRSTWLARLPPSLPGASLSKIIPELIIIPVLGEKFLKKYNYIVSAVMLAIAGYVFYETGTYKIGSSAQKNPALWPRFLAVLLIILSVLLLIETFLKKESESNNRDVVIDWGSPGMKKVYIMVGITVMFVILMHFFGMLIALAIALFCVELLMGCRNKLMLIILPIALVIFCHFFFEVAMKITLPQPFWA